MNSELAKAPHTCPLSSSGRGIFLFDLGRHQSRGQGPESETDQSDTDHKAAHTEHHAEDGKGSNLDLEKRGATQSAAPTKLTMTCSNTASPTTVSGASRAARTNQIRSRNRPKRETPNDAIPNPECPDRSIACPGASTPCVAIQIPSTRHPLEANDSDLSFAHTP